MYLFVEQGEGRKGLRLYLTRTAEETDPKKIKAMRRRSLGDEDAAAARVFLVYFRVAE